MPIKCSSKEAGQGGHFAVSAITSRGRWGAGRRLCGIGGPAKGYRSGITPLGSRSAVAKKSVLCWKSFFELFISVSNTACY